MTQSSNTMGTNYTGLHFWNPTSDNLSPMMQTPSFIFRQAVFQNSQIGNIGGCPDRQHCDCSQQNFATPQINLTWLPVGIAMATPLSQGASLESRENFENNLQEQEQRQPPCFFISPLDSSSHPYYSTGSYYQVGSPNCQSELYELSNSNPQFDPYGTRQTAGQISNNSQGSIPVYAQYYLAEPDHVYGWQSTEFAEPGKPHW